MEARDDMFRIVHSERIRGSAVNAGLRAFCTDLRGRACKPRRDGKTGADLARARSNQQM
jgi:hypothetical protein